MDQLAGFIEAIVYEQPENGFTVAKLKEPKKKELVIIVGCMPSIQPGETIACKGAWKFHPSHGRQFEVAEYHVEMPSDVLGIQKYLESGLVKGVGPVYAKKIVEKFGADTLLIIDEVPRRLLEIPGFGEKKLEKLIDCWKVQKSIRKVMVFLRSHGVSPAYAQKIYKIYGDKSIEKVRENPYQLAQEITGIGFKLADQIAQKLGFALHSPERIKAGIEYVLWELSGDGHTCYPQEGLTPLLTKALEVEESLIQKELAHLIEKNFLIKKGELVWLKPFFAYEMGISKDLFRLCQSPQAIRAIDAVKAADWVEKQLNLQFAVQQKQAVIRALTDKVHIITGGPGTGKSTITNAIITVTEKLTDSILLAAPTGRAAKRMTQITRRMAFTIHSLLEMDFASGGFKRGKDNPLNCDLLIIDEASMIDTALLFALLRAIPNTSRLLLVGDIDQLPSVGPGNTLRDIMQSRVVGITQLTEIFRQAKGSKIVTNAHRINHGEFPLLGPDEGSDFHFIETQTPEAIQQVILQLVSREIPQKWKFDPIDDIQVLSPMKRGVIGVEMLNDALQQLLNPGQKPLLRAGRKFLPKDKVMQIKNNYDKKVYNGDIGKIVEIDPIDQVVLIDFDGKTVEYDYAELDEISLAYTTSIHKYQGSECPCIVVPIHTSHFKLLHRNLLYTAITRGKKQVYLVGTKKAVAIAIHNDQIQKRYTGLVGALKEIGKEEFKIDLQLEFNVKAT